MFAYNAVSEDLECFVRLPCKIPTIVALANERIRFQTGYSNDTRCFSPKLKEVDDFLSELQGDKTVSGPDEFKRIKD